MKILLLILAFLVILIPTLALAEDSELESQINVSIKGEPVINLDSSNKLLRAYVDIVNFTPSDGFYFMKIVQSSTNTIISEEEILIRAKGNGKAGADVAHMFSEDELYKHGNSIQGNYDLIIFSEFGNSLASIPFTIIKPSDANYLIPQAESAEEEQKIEQVSIESESNKKNENTKTKVAEEVSIIPKWVKNIFILYSEGSITETELISALKYLIDQGIIDINS